MPRPTFFALPDEKRARVVDAAVAEFARAPYAKASLDVVAASAGVSKGSLYQYFDDKRDLYAWLVLEWLPTHKMQEAPAAIRSKAGDEAPWCRLAEAMVVGVRAASIDDRAAALAALGARVMVPAGDVDADAVHRQVHEQRHQVLCQLVQAWREAGHVRGDVAVDVLAELMGHFIGQGLLATLARRAGIPPDDYAALPAAVAALPDDVITAVINDVGQVAASGLSGG